MEEEEEGEESGEGGADTHIQTVSGLYPPLNTSI